MLRASVILKNTRLDKAITLPDVSKKLKIPQKHLESIEVEARSGFPAEPYCSLMVKDYANYLGLNGDDILSLFRRDFASTPSPQATTLPHFAITPQTVFRLSTVTLIVLIAVYIIFEYLKFNRPPIVTLTWPEDVNLSANSQLEIAGITDPESSIRINNDLTIIDSTGSFRKSIKLTSPETKITIEAKSHSGQITLLEKIYHPK